MMGGFSTGLIPEGEGILVLCNHAGVVSLLCPCLVHTMTQLTATSPYMGPDEGSWPLPHDSPHYLRLKELFLRLGGEWRRQEMMGKAPQKLTLSQGTGRCRP